MPIVSSHANGAPCWFELGTTDQSGANEFYKSLFGWDIVDVPIGEGMTYSMYKLGGKDVAAAFKLMPELLEAGVPPHWGVYFSTADADATAARVTELGGKVRQAPFDVAEHGRMAVFSDPEGAGFSAWQAKQHVGSTIVGDLNTVCWSELISRDIQKASAFYIALFRWKTQVSKGQPVQYFEFSPEGAAMPAGGMLQMDAQWQGAPAYWGIYFRVNDCDTVVAQIKQLGGSVKHGPFDAPGVGRIAMCSDPQGAMFSIIHLNA